MSDHSIKKDTSLSKLPRPVAFKDDAKIVEEMLKKQQQEDDLNFATPTSWRSQNSIHSKIPIIEKSCEHLLTSKSYAKLTAPSVVVKRNVLSLSDILKLGIKSLGGAIGTEKNHILKQAKEIPAIWVKVVATIAASHNEMMEFIIDNCFEDAAKKFSVNTDDIKEKIELAKIATNNSLFIMAKTIDEILTKAVAFDKQQRTTCSKNVKIETLSSELKKTKTAYEELKEKSKLKEMELETKIKKAKSEISSMKRGFECRLKEKSEHVTATKESIQTQTDEKLKEPEDLPATVIEEEYTPAIVAETETEDKNETTKKKIKYLKATVRRLENSVDKLSKQNENLRKLVNTDHSVSKEMLQMTGKNLANSLLKILSEKQRNLEKLSQVVDMIKQHNVALRVHRSTLEGRVDLLESQFKG